MPMDIDGIFSAGQGPGSTVLWLMRHDTAVSTEPGTIAAQVAEKLDAKILSHVRKTLLKLGSNWGRDHFVESF